MESDAAIADGLSSPTLKKKKKKKKKRRHSEVDSLNSKLLSTPQQELDSRSEKRKERKRKKRKREEESNGLEAYREGVQSHLELPPQDEDWLLGDMWRIGVDAKGSSERTKKPSEPSTEPKQSKQTEPEAQPQSQSVPHQTLPLPSLGPASQKKKKKRKKQKLREDIDETKGNPENSERFNDIFLIIFVYCAFLKLTVVLQSSPDSSRRSLKSPKCYTEYSSRKVQIERCIILREK